MKDGQKAPGKAELLDIRAILDRVAEVTESVNDSQTARALDTTPQALANWRARGTIPFDRLFALAQRNGLSLEFIFFGSGSRKRRTTNVDPHLFTSVTVALAVEIKKRPQLERSMSLAMRAYSAALVYNDVCNLPDAEQGEAARREAGRVAHILSAMELVDALELARSVAAGDDAVHTRSARRRPGRRRRS